MKIDQKISLLKKTIKEIKNISEKLDDNNKFETKIDELNREIARLRKGISDNIIDLEEFLEDENARS